MINVEVSSQEYHVFINHCGKDVKKTVASLVYHTLSNKQLKVFLDYKSLQQGQPFPLTIQQAIASASIHIAIFSNKYAESAWCLRELCLMEESGASIIPIFCGVRPRDLRKNGGVYSKSLSKHRLTRRVDGETVEKWRATLRRISYNYGFQFQG
ncbi:probable 2' cyclic ADP-D-ribose synthase BdTIR [Cryptomeria japonica]|uniref:probable 2' cyclic ADP-D-ribose synthase BdTIR n=1 Tax=Cryptomeria japonica TaxID=3369 RepID=UPI0027DA83C9|nr:probable 2' cyclic ADP-D-ribose synthase BdTIR [Cryptomeria japonica]